MSVGNLKRVWFRQKKKKNKKKTSILKLKSNAGRKPESTDMKFSLGIGGMLNSDWWSVLAGNSGMRADFNHLVRDSIVCC